MRGVKRIVDSPYGFDYDMLHCYPTREFQDFNISFSFVRTTVPCAGTTALMHSRPLPSPNAEHRQRNQNPGKLKESLSEINTLNLNQTISSNHETTRMSLPSPSDGQVPPNSRRFTRQKRGVSSLNFAQMLGILC